MNPKNYECPRLPTLHKIAIDTDGVPRCVSCRDQHGARSIVGVLKYMELVVERVEKAVITAPLSNEWLTKTVATEVAIAKATTPEPPVTPVVIAPSCQLHPQSGSWLSTTGLRCAICSALLDGTQPARQEPITRNLDTFQTEAARVTGGWQDGLQLDPAMARLLKAACTLASEAGEVMNEVNRIVFSGWPLDDAMREKLIRELGDVQWGVAEAASALGIELSRVATENTRKLRERFPSGWSVEASMAGRKSG